MLPDDLELQDDEGVGVGVVKGRVLRSALSGGKARRKGRLTMTGKRSTSFSTLRVNGVKGKRVRVRSHAKKLGQEVAAAHPREPEPAAALAARPH